MSTPKPPTDAELRATYEKMSDAELEKEVKTLGKRLSDGGQYSGADLDTRKFHAVEAVAKTRADAGAPERASSHTDSDGWKIAASRTSADERPRRRRGTTAFHRQTT